MNEPSFHYRILDLILVHAWENALDALEQQLYQHPSDALSLRLLARIHIHKGCYAKALETLETAVKHGGGTDAEIEKTLLVPLIPESSDMIQQTRARMHAGIQGLIASGKKISGPVEMLHIPAFYLAYQGQNDRQLQEEIADLLLRCAPSLAFTAPHCQNKIKPKARKIRVGLCSNNLRKNSVGLFYLGFAQTLPRQTFELHLLRTPAGGSDDVTRQFIKAADHDTLLSPTLETARRQISDKALDILFYPDLTVHPLVNWLAHARLAPIQMTSWGHPVTSGLPQMDYYISSRLMESTNCRDHYSEQLVALSVLPCCYTPPRLLSSPVQRHHFSLPEDRHLYCCGHQAFKLHPDFDAVLAKILRKDPKSELILINAWGDPHHAELLKARINSTQPDVADRIKVMGRLSYIQYLAMARLMDVHLDPVWFGGGRTSFDLLNNGNIVITWPGPYQRGRVTGACLKSMGVNECTASDWDDYVDRAVAFANDPDLRRQTQKRIEQTAPLMLNPNRFTEELALFMKNAFVADM